MTCVSPSSKACSINPLKVSPALGGALAYLGIERAMPLLHGSQGCTAFALVLLVRHFREAIPLQTTAMSELSSILGSTDNLEEAIINLRQRTNPGLIGICTTALSETRGEDFLGELKVVREQHPDWSDLDVVVANTPDGVGSLQEGWAAACSAIIRDLVPEGRAERVSRQINLLCGSQLTPADVEEVREMIESFGFDVIALPDLSSSLDGHVADRHVATSLGGTPLKAIRDMARSTLTLAIGEHMRASAALLEKRTGVPYRVVEGLVGLEAVDAFIATLMGIAPGTVPARLKRDRSRLIDAMLDGHFHFSHRDVAIAAEPDLLASLCSILYALGARVRVAVTTSNTPVLQRINAENIIIGDLGDLEDHAQSCDLLIGNAHVDAIARRMGKPLYRAGFPITDRLGAPQRVSVGYRGSRDLIFEMANLMLDHHHETTVTLGQGPLPSQMMGLCDHAAATAR